MSRDAFKTKYYLHLLLLMLLKLYIHERHWFVVIFIGHHELKFVPVESLFEKGCNWMLFKALDGKINGLFNLWWDSIVLWFHFDLNAALFRPWYPNSIIIPVFKIIQLISWTSFAIVSLPTVKVIKKYRYSVGIKTFIIIISLSDHIAAYAKNLNFIWYNKNWIALFFYKMWISCHLFSSRYFKSMITWIRNIKCNSTTSIALVYTVLQ